MMMKLYTKTVCPKCMLIKSELNVAGLEGQFETINIDQDNSAKEKIVNAGFMSVPILEVGGKLIHDFAEMNEYINKLVTQ
jgi:glutaredoxin